MASNKAKPGNSGADSLSSQGRQRAVARGRSAVVLAALAASVSIAGCGAGPTSSATATGGGASGASSTSRFQQAMKFADCMRTHGVPGFPDPNSAGNFAYNGNTNSQQFLAAENDCKSLAPAPPSSSQQAQSFSEALKFAQCMRAHGLPNFPDPTKGSDGTISQSIGSNVGSPNSPQFQKADQACRADYSGPGGNPPAGSAPGN
jgi:hypothetical protein